MIGLVQVPDPFAMGIDDVPTSQERLRQHVEEATFAEVLPFELQKTLVNDDHVNRQTQIWGGTEYSRPLQVTADGRNG